MELVIQVLFGSILGIAFLYVLIRAIINAVKLLIEVHKKDLIHEISCILLPFYSIFYVSRYKDQKKAIDYLGAILLSLIALSITIVTTKYIWISPIVVYVIIGWVQVFRDAMKKSTLKGILAMLLPPYGFYYILKEKEEINVFDFVYYFSLAYLPILLIGFVLSLSILFIAFVIAESIVAYIVLSILFISGVIGWYQTVIDLKKQSRVQGILYFFPPVTLVKLFENIKKPRIFQLIFYVVQIISYAFLLVLIIYLLTKIAMPFLIVQILLLVLFGLLTVLAMKGFIQILKDAFQKDKKEGQLCLLWPYAMHYTLRKKDNVDVYDVLFFIHQIILYAGIIFPLLKNPFIVILSIVKFASILMVLYSFIFTILDAFKKSALDGILSIFLPFYWLYYAIAKLDQDHKQYNFIKWGFSIAFPIFLLFLAL
ncbi:hypothetical protein ACFL4L_05040 [bacterium]